MKLATLSLESGQSPRKGPIYYVQPTILNHSEIREIKTAGRRFADFLKTCVWSTHAGQT